MRVLVVGFGNPLRSDDAVGWRVANALEEANLGPDVEIATYEQLTPELADAISRAGKVIFVNAVNPAVTSDGALPQPGTIFERELEPACESARCFSQDPSPSTLLACAAELFGATAQGIQYSVAGSKFGPGRELSPAVEASVTELVSRIQAHVCASVAR